MSAGAWSPLRCTLTSRPFPFTRRYLALWWTRGASAAGDRPAGAATRSKGLARRQSVPPCFLRGVTSVAKMGENDMVPPYKFDKKAFEQQVEVLAVIVPTKSMSHTIKDLKPYVLKSRRQKNVVNSPDCGEGERALLLRSDIGSDLEQFFGQIVAEQKNGAQVAARLRKETRMTTFSFTAGYEELSMGEALRKIIPPELDTLPTSFEAVGHLAHLNLREQFVPYKHLIGQILLDKNPRVETVINKTGIITEVFRTFPMEVIAGRKCTQVDMIEHGARFRFDFSKVYWNSRLGDEHRRLVERFGATDIVVDPFCGVGPFAIPAALKGCTVHASDLNPESHKALVDNVQLNAVADKVICANRDAREYIREKVSVEKVVGAHYIMNLPDSAVSFLDAFVGIFPRDLYQGDEDATQDAPPAEKKQRREELHPLPMIHCYFFANPEDSKKLMVSRAEAVMRGKLDLDLVEVRKIRNVAPLKHMFCLHFQLPASIAFS